MKNILEVIKKAPKDHVYYCLINGDCYVEITNDEKYPITVRDINDTDWIGLTEKGKYFTDSETPDSECILFPSRDNRDWEAFERELDGVKDNDSRFNPPAYGTDSYKDGVFSGYCKMGDMIEINLNHEYYKEFPYIDFQIDGEKYRVSTEDIKRLAMNSTKDMKERLRVVEKGYNKYGIDIESKEKNVSGKSFFDNTFDGTAEIVSIPDRPMMAAVIMSGMLAGGCKDKGAALINKAVNYADMILDYTKEGSNDKC